MQSKSEAFSKRFRWIINVAHFINGGGGSSIFIFFFPSFWRFRPECRLFVVRLSHFNLDLFAKMLSTMRFGCLSERSVRLTSTDHDIIQCIFQTGFAIFPFNHIEMVCTRSCMPAIVWNECLNSVIAPKLIIMTDWHATDCGRVGWDGNLNGDFFIANGWAFVGVDRFEAEALVVWILWIEWK